MRLAILFVGILSIGLLAPSEGSRAAHAAARRPRLEARIAWSRAHVPHVSAAGSRLADAALRARIASGLPATLAVHVVACAGSLDEGRLVASEARSCDIVYDEWERRYDVRVAHAAHRFDALDAALTDCLDLHDVAIGRPDDWRIQRAEETSFGLSVELNPPTRDRARSMSDWLARSEGGVGAPTFLGSLIGPAAVAHARAERTLGMWRLAPRGADER